MDEQSTSDPSAEQGPPTTGNPVVDQALTELRDLGRQPLAEHHDRLSAAQDVLSGVLDSSRGAVQTPIPGVLRPGGGQPGAGGQHG